MNFLQLCQSAIAECGASGTILTTTISQTGEQLRFVNWVTQARIEIQNSHEDWGFMRSSYLLGLPTGQGVYFVTAAGRSNYPLGTTAGVNSMVAPANFGKWDEYSFRNYSTSDSTRRDEIFMDPITFDDWRDAYMLGALRQVQTRPIAVALDPD